MPIHPANDVCIVLVRARNPLNIGAAARAMRDFGFSDLRVVNEYAVPFEEARSAVDASELLASAQTFATVAGAVADCGLVLGTTALGSRRLEHPVVLLRNVPCRLAAFGGRTALVFGSEKTGLSNEEMSHCHALLTIPMAAQGVSMNLGQAVAVCLYELSREADAPRALPEPATAAQGEALERTVVLLREVLRSTEYDRRFPGNVGEEALRRLVLRLSLSSDDAEVWMGILRQVIWKTGRSAT